MSRSRLQSSIMNAVEEYVEASQLQTRDNIHLIDEFVDEISEMHGKCIDIGCGPGIVTRQYLLPKLPLDATVVGCDISSKMIDYAKTISADEERLSFIELDIQSEHLPQTQIGMYDNAVSFYCMHWCRDIRKVFENVYQLLRPGGKCLVLFVADHAFYDAIMKLQENPKYALYMKDAHKFIPLFQNCKNSGLRLRNILKQCGFKVIHCSFREKTFTHENLPFLKKFIQALHPFSESIPVNIIDEFENDFVREIIKTKCYYDDSDEKQEILNVYKLLVAYVKKK